MQYFIVDAFTSTPFCGNPAGVVLVQKPLTEQTMQKIATEMNLSDTAFLWALQDVPNPWKNCARFKLRWFTPAKEAILCGHATLASYHVLFHELGNASDSIVFESMCGPLTVSKEGDGIKLDFPSYPGRPLSHDEEDELRTVISAVTHGKYDVSHKLYDSITKNLLIQISSNITRKEFEDIQPDFGLLKAYNGSKLNGIIITTKGDFDEPIKRGFEDNHFASRYFAPWYGILEDPVTGSAHSTLTPFWSKELGATELNCIQCSRRIGVLKVVDKGNHRVNIIGKAVTMFSGNVVI